MEVPIKQLKRTKRSEARSLDPPENWVVATIKTEPVEGKLVNVKTEPDDPDSGTNNGRFVVDGVAAESMWTDDIEIGQVKIEPADESDDSYANAANCESSSELTDGNDAEPNGITMNAFREMRKMLPGSNGKRLEINQPEDERVRFSLRWKKVATETMSGQAPTGSTKPIGRSPRAPAAKTGKAHGAKASKQFRCEQCRVEYKTKLSLEIHTSVHHRDSLEEEPLHVCSECGNTYAHAELLKRHQLVHMRKPCPACGTMVAYYNFKQHLANHEPNQPRYRCELCSRSYKTARYLREHIAVKHASDNRNCETYVCGECDQEFVNRIQFKIHRRNHRLSSRVCCEFCYKSYSRKWLNVHIATEHSPGGNVPRKR